tara:strand:- start:148 stop:303 length:156 start_codon:yes stop_codon:yes gene_type:complete
MIKKAIANFLRKTLVLFEDNTGKPVPKKKAPVMNKRKRQYRKRKPKATSKS